MLAIELVAPPSEMLFKSTLTLGNSDQTDISISPTFNATSSLSLTLSRAIVLKRSSLAITMRVIELTIIAMKIPTAIKTPRLLINVHSPPCE